MSQHIISPPLFIANGSWVNKTMLSTMLTGTLVLAATMPYKASANAATVNNSPAATHVETYRPEFFMSFDPQTLYDILEDIPGVNSLLVSLSSATESRGFGSSGDQILINSKRVSGKENSLDNELDNIQAGDVEYVELIRGTRSDLDVQSKGLVVNVVLKKDIESSTLWSVSGVKTSDMESKTKGSVVYSAATGDLKYRLGISTHVNPTKLSYNDQYSSQEQLVTDNYSRTRRNWYKVDQISAKLEYILSPDAALQLNALSENIYVDASIKTIHDNWLDSQQNTNTIIIDWGRDSWEISGDITHKIDQNNHLKLLFISNYADSNDLLWRTSVLPDQSLQQDYLLPRLYTAKENVLRGNWKHQLNTSHSLDSGAEIAINSHDEYLEYIEQSGGIYHTTEINNIEETRYEAFVNYNYVISSKLNLQSSLIYERSKLDAATDFSLQADTFSQASNQSSRTFSYLKPRINLRYDFDDIYQIRFNYERTVSQLNLDDFVPEFNRDETRLEETNPDLKPEMRDEVALSIEKQWLSTDGSITFTPYYHKISDLITEIPLVAYSGDGNVDSGKEYGVKLDTSFSLSAFGMDNTMISASYTWRDSDHTHPFTGKSAPIERLSDNEWSLKINQNELLSGLSFSLTLNKASPYEFSRFDYLGERREEMSANAFIDYQINKYLKVRLTGQNLLKDKSSYDRVRYTGRYTEADVLRREQRNYQKTARYILSLTGQF